MPDAEMISTETRAGATDYRDAFERRMDAPAPPWLAERRREAWQRFEALGFPTTKDELWKYTSVAKLARQGFSFAEAGAATPSLETLRQVLPDETLPRLVFVDGRLAPELSSAGTGALDAESLALALDDDSEALEHRLGRIAGSDEHPFVALNTALFEDGAVLRLAPGTRQETPLLLCFVSATPGVVSHPRVLVVAERGSQAQLIETHVGLADGVTFSNAVTEIHLGPGATLDHYKLQEELPRGYHLATTTAHLERDAALRSHVFAFGGTLARNELEVDLTGEGAGCELQGLYVGRDRDHVDCQTYVDHAVPHCTSNQTYHGVLDDSARGVFNGGVLVRKDAQITAAHQSNRNLLLSAQAAVDTKPALEIHANDVKCSHGATIGRLDADALFYLRSRAIGERDARVLLTRAFAGAVVEGVRVEALSRHLDRILERTFSRDPARPPGAR